MMNHILNQVKSLFEERWIKYFCNVGDGVIGAAFEDTKILFEIDANLVEFCLIFDEEMRKDRKYEVQEYINYVNRILKEGHFEMDDEGTVQFRICTDISETQDISEKRLFVMMAKAAGAKENFQKNMVRVSNGSMEAKEAFAEVLMAA